MPQIKEYNSQISAPGPIQTRQATAEDFGSYTGAALGEFGSAVRGAGDAIQKRAAQQEVTTWFKKLAEKHAGETEDLMNRMKNPDPNDPEYKKFASSYEEAAKKRWDTDLDSEQPQTLEGRQFVERQRAEMSQHFNESAIQLQAKLQGQKAAADVQTGINTFANATQSRPGDYDINKGKVYQAIDAMVKSELIGETQAEQFRKEADTQLAISAVYGWAKGDSAHAKELLDSDFYGGAINATQKHALYRDIHVQEESERTAKRQAQYDADHAKAKLAESDKVGLVDKLLKQEPIDIQKDIVDNPHYTAQDKLNMFALVKNKKTELADNSVNNDLFARIHQLDGAHMAIPSDSEIQQAVADERITVPQYKFLMAEKIGNNSPEGRELKEQNKALYNAARASYGIIGKGNIISDPDAYKKMESFQNAFLALRAKADKEGVPRSALYDQNNKQWYGGNLINQFYENPQQIMMKKAQSIGGAAKPPDRGGMSIVPNPEAQNDPSQPPEKAAGNLEGRNIRSYKEVLDSELEKAISKTKRLNPATSQMEDVVVPAHPNRVANITQQTKEDYADWLDLQKDPIHSTVFNPQRLYDKFGGEPIIKYQKGVPYVAGWKGGKEQAASQDKTMRPGEDASMFLKRMGVE